MIDYKEYCIREAQFHVNRAREILEDGLKDPKKYYEETTETYRLMAPWYAMMMYTAIHNRPDASRESSQS